MFIHSLQRYYVNKTRLGFNSSNFTRVALRKDVCIFAILISKSAVSRAIFDNATGVFNKKISYTSYSRPRKCFCKFLFSLNILSRRSRKYCFLRIAETEK